MIDKRTTNWQEQARCREIDPDAFFPDNEDGSQAENSRTMFTLAKRICRDCEVRAECLVYALNRDSEYRYGVWGGYGPVERERLSHKLKDKSPAEVRVWLEKNDKRSLR